MSTVKPIPEGYHTVTPYLIVQNAARLVQFMQEAFGAAVVHRSDHPDGSLMHADMTLGDSHVMIGGARAEWPGQPTSIYLYVEDCDATYTRALEAGGTSIMEPMDMFYGDRHGGVKDPTGNSWWMATHIEDVSPEELEKRAQAAVQERAKS